jgi:hypothetical protein
VTRTQRWALALASVAALMAALDQLVVAVIAFMAWEARASGPMLPVKLFADRTLSAANMAAFSEGGSRC